MQMIVTICLFLVSPKRWVWFCTVGEEGPWSTLSLPWIRQWLRPRIQDEEIPGKTTYDWMQFHEQNAIYWLVLTIRPIILTLLFMSAHQRSVV